MASPHSSYHELPQTSQEDNTVSEPSDDLISLNSPQFREYLAQFIACTNNIINDLLQRVEALEAELQRPSSCRSSDLSQYSQYPISDIRLTCGHRNLINPSRRKTAPHLTVPNQSQGPQQICPCTSPIQFLCIHILPHKHCSRFYSHISACSNTVVTPPSFRLP